MSSLYGWKDEVKPVQDLITCPDAAHVIGLYVKQLQSEFIT
jgi:hypothetical protein